MTLFEYLSVGYSIVLSLTIVRLLGGLPATVASDRRYWVHVVWIGIVLIRSVLFWWNFWSYHEVATWNFFSFALVLLVPGLLYIMAATLIPDSPSSVGSWQAHFYAVHRRFFIIFALSILATVATSHLVLGVPLLHPLRGVQVFFFVVALSAAATSNSRFHEMFAVTLPFCILPIIIFFFLEPGQLVSSP
jgi:hypothetical protein